jgi:hypothetical protein
MFPNSPIKMVKSSRRSPEFYLILAVAGYFTIASAIYLQTIHLDPPPTANLVGTWDLRTEPKPEPLIFVFPGALIGFLGLLQLRLTRKNTLDANRAVMAWSFRCSAFALLAFGLAYALSELDDILGVVLAITTVLLFLSGIVLAVINIAWSLVRSRRPA